MFKKRWILIGYAALGLTFPTGSWAETSQEEPPAAPVLILPSEYERVGKEIELELHPNSWNGRTKETQNSDALSIKAVGQLGSRGRTFARWRRQEQKETVEAGLECSLFGCDHWKLSHQVQSVGDTTIDKTKLSLGVEVSQATKLSLTGSSSPLVRELGTGLSYKTDNGFEWGATVKAQRLPGAEDGWLWNKPAIESSLRLTW